MTDYRNFKPLFPEKGYATEEKSVIYRNYSWTEAWSEAIFEPSRETFEALSNASDGSTGRAFRWVAVTGFVSAVIMLAIAYTIGGGNLIIGDDATNISDSGLGFAILMPIILAIGMPISFGILALILLAVGNGVTGRTIDFGDFVFSLASVYCPLQLIGSIALVFPVIGSCVALILGLYYLYLLFLVAQGTFDATAGQAFIIAASPLLLGFLLSCCLSMMAGGGTA